MNRRFRLFLLGFIIGIIAVILIYGDKANTMFDWTPEGRVLKRLRLTERVISDSMQCVLDCHNFGEEQWKHLYKEGDVNFGQARHKPFPIYSVDIQNEDLSTATLTFSTEDELSILIAFDGEAKSCECP